MNRILISATLMAFISLEGLFSCRYRTELAKAEAETYLKALDSDITHLLDGISESDAGRALHVLLANDSAPFPVRFPRSFLKGGRKTFAFERYAGAWNWDPADSSFRHAPGGDRIIISYPMPGHQDNNATCIIYRYLEESTTSAHAFPVLFTSDFFVGNRKVFSIDHRAGMVQNIPVFIRTNISLEGGSLSCSLENELDTIRHMGDVRISVTATIRGATIMDGAIQARIRTFPGGAYSVKKIRSGFRIFDCAIETDIDYSEVDRTSRNYVQEFNEHSSIRLFTRKGHEKIGDIILKERVEGKILDFAVRFSDLSDDFLANYILAFKKILDVKTSK